LQQDGGDVNPLLASGCDRFIGCDTTTEQLTKNQQHQFLPCRYPSSNPSDILSPTFVLLTKTLLCHHPLRDFIRNRWKSASSSSMLESAGPWFPKSSLSESQSLCKHPLLHLLYVIGNEAVTAERFRALRLARETSTHPQRDYISPTRPLLSKLRSFSKEWTNKCQLVLGTADHNGTHNRTNPPRSSSTIQLTNV